MRALVLVTLLLLVSSSALVACAEGGAPTADVEPAPPTGAAEGAPAPSETGPAVTVVSWEDARDFIGGVVTVEGPVAGTRYAQAGAGEPTFLTIGREVADPKRLVIVIWGEDRDSFPEPPEDTYADRTIQVTGHLLGHEGMLRMDVASPDAIKIVE
jgi:hypothetical protein